MIDDHRTPKFNFHGRRDSKIEFSIPVIGYTRTIMTSQQTPDIAMHYVNMTMPVTVDFSDRRFSVLCPVCGRSMTPITLSMHHIRHFGDAKLQPMEVQALTRPETTTISGNFTVAVAAKPAPAVAKPAAADPEPARMQVRVRARVEREAQIDDESDDDDDAAEPVRALNDIDARDIERVKEYNGALDEDDMLRLALETSRLDAEEAAAANSKANTN